MHKGDNATGATSTSLWTCKSSSYFQIEREANKRGRGCYEGARQPTNVLTSSKQPHYIYSLGLFSRLFQEKSIFIHSIQWKALFSPIQTSVTDYRGSTWNQGVQSSCEENSGFSRWLNSPCHHQSIFIPSFSASLAFVSHSPNPSTSTVKTQITIQPA